VDLDREFRFSGFEATPFWSSNVGLGFGSAGAMENRAALKVATRMGFGVPNCALG